MARKNIKVPEDLFHALSEDKDNEQSWPHYLETECLNDPDDNSDVDTEALAEDLQERIDYPDSQDTETIMQRLDELWSSLPERTADEVEGRMR